ncbi:MAG: protein phosphatase 2C domain-containing protein [Microcystaceae cyanobacterium]
MNSQSQFAVAGGSVIGRNHALMGKNNQDAYESFSNDNLTLAVVCDGCGSCPHSEVGAKWGAKLWIKTLLNYVETYPNQPINQTVIKDNLLQELEKMVISLAVNQTIHTIIHDYFLFTLIGVVITPQLTTIMALGDGIISVNEQLTVLPDFPNNAPPYLAYQLLDTITNFDFIIHEEISTQDVNSILIGTDGVKDLFNLENLDLKVTNIYQFYQNESYFKNPDLIRRHLFLMNREKIIPNWQTRKLNKEIGLLSDDTTLIVIKKNPFVGMQENLRPQTRFSPYPKQFR